MRYAVVQSQIDKPNRDALKTAFQVLSELVDLDAATLSQDAYGIITGGLAHEEATRLAEALNAQGVRTQAVPEADFPALSPAKHIRRLDCAPDHMLLHDALGRTTRIPWDRVVMVAAGLVTESAFTRIEHTRVVLRGTGYQGGAFPILLTDVSHKEELKGQPVIELYLNTAPVRLAINGHEFQYDYLAARLKPRYTDNFALLVQDVATFASAAILNRGAESLRHGNAVTYHYPSRHAFEEEIVWLLWAAMQSRRAKVSVPATPNGAPSGCPAANTTDN